MTCKDCIHYDICVFHLKGNENEKCLHFKNKSKDIRTEVAREIFAEIEDDVLDFPMCDTDIQIILDKGRYDELKNKYTKEGGE